MATKKSAPKKSTPKKPAAPAPAPPNPDPSEDQQLSQRWPSYSWALSIPELKAILTDPNVTDPNELQSKIEGTSWWKQTQPAQRNWIARQNVDPAGANQDKQQKEADIWDRYLGLGLNANQQQVQDLAVQALSMGWTDTQLNDAIVSHVQYTPDLLNQAGSIATNARALKQQAASYYVSLDDRTAADWSKKIAAGEATANDFMPTLQTWAKSKYAFSPEIVSAIDSGVTTKDYFAPYQQEAAKLLETNADSIDLANDPKWSQVTSYADPKTGQRRVMTINEMQTFTRGMDQWKTTRQGQQAAADAAEGILKTFGKIAS